MPKTGGSLVSLGAGSGSKAAAMYLAKYALKQSAEISASCAVLIDAQAHIKEFASVAEDAEVSEAGGAVVTPFDDFGLPEALLAWFLRKRPALVQHFPAIHGDSAQTKGTVLLSIVSSSLLHRLGHVKHTLTFCTPAGGTNTSSCQPGRDTLSRF